MPRVDEDVSIDDLNREVRRDLYSLPETLSEKVAGQLLMSARLLHLDPDAAVVHAKAAHDLAPRVAAVREALAIAAYTSGDFKTAMREARTARRMTGSDEWLPMIADCERGLGRPERALELLDASTLQSLATPVQAEALIVASGARADLGQAEAAVMVLDTDLLRSPKRSTWAARLRFAYSEALQRIGDSEEALKWLKMAVATDPDGSTGAGARLAEVEGIEFQDLEQDASEDVDGSEATEPAPDDQPAEESVEEPDAVESDIEDAVADEHDKTSEVVQTEAAADDQVAKPKAVEGQPADDDSGPEIEGSSAPELGDSEK